MKLQSMLFIAATTFSTVGLYSGEKAETAVLPSEAVVMTAGELWHPFQFFRQVEKNSALDFSSNLDAPAGKYGRVIAGVCSRRSPRSSGSGSYGKRRRRTRRLHGNRRKQT